ncbi:MAG TPA: FAD binding domain-containing protein [Gemmatimonadales bacterium]|nr:FAD binding domain-containing protein [Gemmatimonadales bacterium]
MFDRIRAFHRPTSVAQALRLFEAERRRGGRGRWVAGGTDLVVQRERALRWLVDLTRLPLGYVRRVRGGFVIGATTRMADIEHSKPLLGFADGILPEAASTCGSQQIRNMATIGGNLANASPACDLAPPLLALDASAVIAGRDGRRIVRLDRFFRGVNRTALNGGLLVEIVVPAPPKAAATGWSCQKLGRLQSDIAIVNAAAGVALDARGYCTWARIALGAVATTPLRARGAEALLVGRRLDRTAVEAAAEQAAAEAKPVTDVRGTADYRRAMCRVLVARALEECARHAGRTL